MEPTAPEPRVLGTTVDDSTPERIAILIGPRPRVVSPALWGAVSAFFDFTFAYQYLTVAVDDNEPEDCSIDIFGNEDCTGGPTVLDRASRDGQTIGLGGGSAFETHAMGDGGNWAEGHESLKVVMRASDLLNDWFARSLRNRGADQVQVALGVLFW